MKITRRALLNLLGVGGLASVGKFGGISGKAIAASGGKPFFLIFDDIAVNTPVDALETLLAPFSDLGIPVGFIVKPGEPADGLAPKAPLLAAFFREFLLQSPDLGEIIAWQAELALQKPYFQVRHASTARARLATFFDLPSSAGLSPLTIACEDQEGDLDVDTVRAAGFRNLMLLSQKAGASISDRCHHSVACMRGSVRHAISEDSYAIIASARAVTGAGDMTVLALSLKDIGTVPPQTLQLRAATLADLIATDVQAGKIFTALPRQHVGWFSTGSARMIALAVEQPPPGSSSAQSGFDALQRVLGLANIPFSLISQASEVSAEDAPYCQRFAAPLRPGEVSANCVFARPLADLTTSDLADAGVATVVQPLADGMSGLDDSGLLHLPEIPISGVSLSGPGSVLDFVMTIPAAAYATEAQRALILATLKDAADGDASTILDMPGFVKAILPADPVYSLMLTTRRDMATVPAPYVTGDDQRAALIEDAKIAWSYFEQMTDTATGLCASTVSLDGKWSSINPVLTMWDYGSLVQATMAGHELGLIDERQFVQRAEAILDGLPAERIGGLMLPSSEISSDGGKSVSHDFNACDTGRLLIALDQMNRHPLSNGWFTKRVAGWDLAGTLRSGHLNSISQGRLLTLFHSHCAHYASRAFKLWGIEAGSPYVTRPDESRTDTHMRLLYEVARIGAIGAEPLLLEAIELGFSPQSAYLADVLFTAQALSFAENGTLIAVSESAMDRAPWFTFQGLKVDADRDVWDVQSIDPASVFQSPDFRDRAHVFSTKAAFLWAAIRPGTYSALLLDYARSHARQSDVGYCSGVYSATGAGMKNYSDINTNGVILQAIAYRLRSAASRQSDASPAFRGLP